MIRLDELGQRKDTVHISSDTAGGSSVCGRGQAYESSVKTNYLHSSSVQTNLLA